MDYQEVDLQKLKDWFLRFAEQECKEVSPFYYQLAQEVAADAELLKLASYSRRKQPMPNLFFAAVQFLLYKNPAAELAAYYPSLTPDPSKGLPFTLFKDFCLKNKAEIISLEQSKFVQTNALNRCAYLMPIVCHLFGGQELQLIDIGTSAGLTLHMDKYAYHYDGTHAFGDSPVKITSTIRAGQLPGFNPHARIVKKVGIDQNPLDVKEVNNALWLQALIWPDQGERLEKLEQAIRIAKQEDIDFQKASTLAEFESIILEQDEKLPILIYHNHTLNQFSQTDRKRFSQLIEDVARKRDVAYLAAEESSVFIRDYGLCGTLVELTTFRKGKKDSRIVAETNGHATWIKWKI